MPHTYINIHSHNIDSGATTIVSVRMRQPGDSHSALPFAYSAGIHPWDAEQENKDLLLKELNSDENIVAIGETGLDYACHVDRKMQQELFEAQLRIAESRCLPVILHCVRAFEPVMRTLSRFSPVAVIFHGFIGSRQQAAQAVEKGYYLSFGAQSLRSPKTVEAIHGIPVENLFLETDDSPVPITELYGKVSLLLGIDEELLAAKTEENYKRIFK